jgi:hypothetical protein
MVAARGLPCHEPCTNMIPINDLSPAWTIWACQAIDSPPSHEFAYSLRCSSCAYGSATRSHSAVRSWTRNCLDHANRTRGVSWASLKSIVCANLHAGKGQGESHASPRRCHAFCQYHMPQQLHHASRPAPTAGVLRTHRSTILYSDASCVEWLCHADACRARYATLGVTAENTKQLARVLAYDAHDRTRWPLGGPSSVRQAEAVTMVWPRR